MIRKGQGDKPPRIQDIRFVHPDGASVHVEIVRLSALRKRKMSHSIFEQTRLDFHLLQIVLDGRGKHMVDFERLNLRAGDLLHIRPGQVHAFDAASTHETLMVIFLPEALAHPIPLELAHPHRTVPLRPRAKDFSLLVDIAQLLEDLPSRGSRIRSQDLGHHFLGALVAATGHLIEAKHALAESAPHGTAALMAQFGSLLEQNHAKQRSVSWYAEQLGVSSRTLVRACEAALHTTPKRHIDARLGLEAKRRLIFSSDYVDELSESLGFSEPTNFVKFFRRVTGETPQAFRRQMFGNNRP